MSVGAVGGVGAAGAGGAAGGGASGGAAGGGAVGGAGAGSSPSGGAGVEGVGSQGDGSSSKSTNDDKGINNTYDTTQIQNNTVFANMSTQDSMELHNCVHGVGSSSETSGIDLNKLIEMLMAIKLLEALNENKGSGGGFSAIG